MRFSMSSKTHAFENELVLTGGCGPILMYPDIFENGDFFLLFPKNAPPHVADLNRFRSCKRDR